jgi:5-(carboxyamino)imidazole ribonucleotide synthase
MLKRIGIVGGGQLGRMLVNAAHKLGFSVTVLDPTAQSPAGQIADAQIVAGFEDEAAIMELAAQSDFLTFEIELAGAKVLEELELEGKKVNPTSATLALIKDKLAQKEFLKKWGIPTADFAGVENKEDVLAAAEKFGYPLVLKARFGGYDGRGNAVIESAAGADAAFEKLSGGGGGLYVEQFVPFTKELSVIAVRAMDGVVATYPVVETVHENNICHTVLAPAPIADITRQWAAQLAVRVMQHLEGAGVFGIEMFLRGQDKVLVNEIAPRVHNSGHHTIEASMASQFENHIRAITGMPLGDTGMQVPAAAMVNILGNRTGAAEPRGVDEASAAPGVSVHIYGKAETRPERKMGHVTAVGDSLKEAQERAEEARAKISI